jgi:uncharacterized sodium:solute symporter family permease YidK
MDSFHTILFVFFIVFSLLITLFLTHLHRRFFNYSKVSEIVIHVSRSYFIFTAITLTVIYLLFRPVNLKYYLFCAGSIFSLHLISAIIYYLFQKRRHENSVLTKVILNEAESVPEISEYEYKLSDVTKSEIIEVLKKSDVLK